MYESQNRPLPLGWSYAPTSVPYTPWSNTSSDVWMDLHLTPIPSELTLQAQLAHERLLSEAHCRAQADEARCQEFNKASREARRKAERSRTLASRMAEAALHGPQPKNAHHKSLRGYSDAPRRPVYRGAR